MLAMALLVFLDLQGLSVAATKTCRNKEYMSKMTW